MSVAEGKYGAAVGLPDGNRLLIQDVARNLPLIWEPPRGQIREPSRMLFRPRCLSFSPDRRVLAVRNSWEGEAGERIVHLWDTERWLPIAPPIRGPGEVASLAFDPTNRTLAAGEDGRVRLWDLASGEDLLILEGHTGWVGPIDFSPDGKTLATCSDSTRRRRRDLPLAYGRG